MYSYGRSSREKLDTVDPRLQEIYAGAIKIMDIKIFCGERGEAEQNKAFDNGFSKVRFPDSNHNKKPGEDKVKAVDAGPYPVDWDTDREVLQKFAKAMKDGVIDSLEQIEIEEALSSLKRWIAYGTVIKAVASQLGYKIRWGGDWDGDWDFTDQTFNDFPHVEIVED